MLQYASAPGFIRTILVILLIYFGFKILARLLGPLLLFFAAKKVERTFKDQFDKAQQNEEPVKKAGEVSIDKIPNSKPSDKTTGDYVDFEEIE